MNCLFLHLSNIFFYVESENNIGFQPNQWVNKLFNFKVICSLFNTEEIQTLIFAFFYFKTYVLSCFQSFIK